MSEERFELIYTQGKSASTTEIWLDNVTGVNYVFHRDGVAAGFTALLSESGTPVISEIQ